MHLRNVPDPVVYTYPHPRDCDAIQGKLDACTGHCRKCETPPEASYQPEDDDYSLDMGLAGALR